MRTQRSHSSVDNTYMLTDVPAFDDCANANPQAQRPPGWLPGVRSCASASHCGPPNHRRFFFKKETHHSFVKKRKKTNKKKPQRLAKKGVFRGVLLTFFRAVLGNHEKKKREKTKKTLLRRVSKRNLWQCCGPCSYFKSPRIAESEMLSHSASPELSEFFLKS